jgi:hypothetical protein
MISFMSPKFSWYVPENVAEVREEITGVSVFNERGMDQMRIVLLQGVDELGHLDLDLETARMIRTALNTMIVLDRGEEQK